MLFQQVAVPLVAVLTVFLVLRLAPLLDNRDRGCDAFLFLMLAAAFRRRRRLPIVLPDLFLLEQPENWYPPGLPIVLSVVPDGWLRRYHWLISSLIDVAVLIGLVIVVAQWHGAVAALVVGGAYGLTPYLVMEYSTLNARALGTALFMAFMFAWAVWMQGDGWAIVAAVLLGVLIVYTHKLTVQLLWFLAPFLALVYADAAWLVPLALSYAVAFLVAPPLFIKIVRAHADIVRFWARHWRHVGAHQVRDSPIYGTAKRGSGFHGEGSVRDLLRQARWLFQYNPWIVIVLAVVFWADALSWTDEFCAWWVAGTYVWAALTMFVPAFKGLGEGTKYVKLALPPSLVLTASAIVSVPAEVVWPLVVACFLLQALLFARIVRALRRNDDAVLGGVSSELSSLIEVIRREANARVLCLPIQLSERVAFEADKPVLWGAHGYGFDRLEPFFPVLREPISYFVSHYGLTHLLLDRRYAPLEALGLSPRADSVEHGDYILARLEQVDADGGNRQ